MSTETTKNRKKYIEDSTEVRQAIADLQSRAAQQKEKDSEKAADMAAAQEDMPLAEEELTLAHADDNFSDGVDSMNLQDGEEYVDEVVYSEEYTEDSSEDYYEEAYMEEKHTVKHHRNTAPSRQPHTSKDVPVQADKTQKNRVRKGRIRQTDENIIISLENVTKSYVKGVPALNNVNIKIRKGEFVFIVGDSGSGKSTLIKLLLRELKPTSGSIWVNGFQVDKLRHGRIPKLRRSMGVVFQDFRLLPDMNVYENVAFAQRIIQTPVRLMKRNVPSMLAMVGLAGKYKAKPNELSGGEQQRVALARALVNQPPILLADEPTGNLDVNNTIEIMNLLEKINENGTTVIVVTHNDKIVNDMQKRVITIKKGVIVSDEEKGGYIYED